MDACSLQTTQDSILLHAHTSTFSTNICAAEEAFNSLADEDLIKVVVIDMSAIYRLDSRGLCLLVDLQKSLGTRGGHLILANVPMALRRLLAYVKLDHFFDMVEGTDLPAH